MLATRIKRHRETARTDKNWSKFRRQNPSSGLMSHSFFPRTAKNIDAPLQRQVRSVQHMQNKMKTGHNILCAHEFRPSPAWRSGDTPARADPVASFTVDCDSQISVVQLFPKFLALECRCEACLSHHLRLGPAPIPARHVHSRRVADVNSGTPAAADGVRVCLLLLCHLCRPCDGRHLLQTG